MDVEEVESGDVSGTRISCLHAVFDRKNGPLWRTKFINATTHKEGCSTSEGDFCGTFKFTCVFGFSHIFTDGITNAKFCNVFLKTLNDLTLGRDVDMKVENEFVEPFDDRLADQEKSSKRMQYFILKRTYPFINFIGSFFLRGVYISETLQSITLNPGQNQQLHTMLT